MTQRSAAQWKREATLVGYSLQLCTCCTVKDGKQHPTSRHVAQQSCHQAVAHCLLAGPALGPAQQHNSIMLMSWRAMCH